MSALETILMAAVDWWRKFYSYCDRVFEQDRNGVWRRKPGVVERWNEPFPTGWPKSLRDWAAKVAKRWP